MKRDNHVFSEYTKLESIKMSPSFRSNGGEVPLYIFPSLPTFLLPLLPSPLTPVLVSYSLPLSLCGR